MKQDKLQKLKNFSKQFRIHLGHRLICYKYSVKLDQFTAKCKNCNWKLCIKYTNTNFISIFVNNQYFTTIYNNFNSEIDYLSSNKKFNDNICTKISALL